MGYFDILIESYFGKDDNYQSGSFFLLLSSTSFEWFRPSLTIPFLVCSALPCLVG